MNGMNPEKLQKQVDVGLHHQYIFNAPQVNNGSAIGGQSPKFPDIVKMAEVSNTDWSWPSLFFDMDNDGLKEFFISNGIKRYFRKKDYLQLLKPKL